MAQTDPAAVDQLMSRLEAVASALEDELAGHATVERDLTADGRDGTVSIEPHRPDALPVIWFFNPPGEMGVQAGQIGGRFELDFTAQSVDFLEDVTRSVIAGRVVEVISWRRTRVEITLGDGTTVRETGSDGILSTIPLPGWPRWARRVQYAPFL